jgi:hypothetical protein
MLIPQLILFPIYLCFIQMGAALTLKLYKIYPVREHNKQYTTLKITRYGLHCVIALTLGGPRGLGDL